MRLQTPEKPLRVQRFLRRKGRKVEVLRESRKPMEDSQRSSTHKRKGFKCPFLVQQAQKIELKILPGTASSLLGRDTF
jgi:hypothetical protein